MASDPRTNLRWRLHRQLDPRAWPSAGLSPLNKLLVVVILMGTGLVIAETEPLLAAPYSALFAGMELALGTFFVVEYLLRLWTAPESAPGAPAWRSRFRFVTSVSGLIDLLVIVATFVPFLGPEALTLRLLRLLRLLQLAKLGRMSLAMRHLIGAVRSRRHELALTVILAVAVMIVGATALFWLESEAQPDKFGSIPRALWWSVVTLTTIGYGDVFPITPAGKIVAALVAFAGIGLIAMPTGILAAALSDAAQKNRREEG